MTDAHRGIDASTIEESLSMLGPHVASDGLDSLALVLRELAEKPHDKALLARLSEVVDNLGIMQGAVLTYAPALAALLSDDPFG